MRLHARITLTKKHTHTHTAKLWNTCIQKDTNTCIHTAAHAQRNPHLSNLGEPCFRLQPQHMKSVYIIWELRKCVGSGRGDTYSPAVCQGKKARERERERERGRKGERETAREEEKAREREKQSWLRAFHHKPLISKPLLSLSLSLSSSVSVP